MLSPQHSVGKQAGEGHGREGGSWLWPLQAQGDHGNGQRREPGPCKVERKVLGVLGDCAEEEVAPGDSFPACSACAGSTLSFPRALLSLWVSSALPKIEGDPFTGPALGAGAAPSSVFLAGIVVAP